MNDLDKSLIQAFSLEEFPSEDELFVAKVHNKAMKSKGHKNIQLALTIIIFSVSLSIIIVPMILLFASWSVIFSGALLSGLFKAPLALILLPLAIFVCLNYVDL